MDNMNLFDKNKIKIMAEPLCEYKIYNNSIMSARYSKIVIPAINYNSFGYAVKFGWDKDIKYLDLKDLRKYIPAIEDYNMPYEWYKEHYSLKLSKNKELGEDFVKTIKELNLNSDCENITIRSLELEGLALDLVYCPDSSTYNYVLCKKIDIDDWETVGFIDYLVSVKDTNYMEKMYIVMREYAKEHNLFFTKIND